MAYQPFAGYLMPNSFLYQETVLFQIIQFSISTQFNCQNISISSYSVLSNSSNSYDNFLEETAFHFIGQVGFPYDR